MPKASPIIPALNAGEFSPLLRGRIDIDKYGRACEKLENFLPQIQGPVKKRPGTRFVAEVKNSAKKTRLIPFEFSNEQAYILEFGDQYIRFYANGGVVVSSGTTPYEIASPYLEADLDQISFAQSADVIYLAHPDYPPRKLSRLAPTNWTLTTIDFVWQPFNDQNTNTASTVTITARTGSFTLTSSANLFTTADVGGYIRIEEVVSSRYSEWRANTSVSTGDERRYENNLYRAVAGGTTGDIPPVHTEGTESDGAVDWEFLHDGRGYALITAFNSATSVGVTVIKRLPARTVPATTFRWAKSAWSPRNGYPKAVTFYEDRLWWAGSKERPQTLWASVVSDYENHRYQSVDDAALNYTINTQDQNAIQWILASKVLSVGTSNGEFTLSAQQISDPVTPTNVRISPQTTYGSAPDVRPCKIGNAIIFAQRAKKRLREYVYNFETDSFVAVNLNVLANHILQEGVVDLSYQQEPSQIIWSPREDGVLTGMTYERAEEVVGWHRHNIGGGVVEAIATIPHWDGDQDSTWMVVKRTIDGQTKRYVEYLEKELHDEYQFYVDSGLTYDGTPTSSLSGLGHLEGEEVAVLVDGAVHPNVTVTSGAITLQYPGSVINVGLSYTATLKTMPLEAGAADGVAQGKTMRINNIVIRLYETGPGLWYGPNEAVMDEYHPRRTTNNMDEAIPLFTGDTPLLTWPGEYEQGVQVTIQHRLPTACTVVAIMPQVTTYDR